MKKIAGWIMIVAGLLLFLLPLVYWMKNPELTQMQIFIECWWLTLGGITLAFAGIRAAEINK